ncbi:MAG: nuclear transport factor 2 family protein [Pyrinomonadaceae bacterium]|nr:nuclear transport factor 2 family protein [Pyrinomonadaceae bacterium]MCX7639882.1 nuclear transport factor 2 family protein [Pyrinomonadaceae bacterium]MDW8304054.1 nuclear transport factor 2 family protein [Acidobacteriota bacterium]
MKKLLETIENHFRFAVEKNVEGILDSYSKSEDLLVFVEGPRWATLGYEAVAKGWRDYCISSINLKRCEWVEVLKGQENGDIGFLAGIVDVEAEINGELRKIRFRGTFVLKNEGDRWRIVHEHFSQPASDPYGVGDWLKE